jgi:hypothetical protein
MIGIIDHLLRLVARKLDGEQPPEIMAGLGELAALQALIGPVLPAVVDPLDGGKISKDAAAQLVGLRLTVQRMLALVETLPLPQDDAIAAILNDLRGSLNIARGPRALRQARLGADLVARSRASS